MTDTRISFNFGENDRARRLALLLQLQDDLEQEMANFKAEWKARMANVRSDIYKLRNEIVGGQMTLPTEPPDSVAAAVP